jgi:predicted ATP-grasp superfamily ATP-dependent carboligase
VRVTDRASLDRVVERQLAGGHSLLVQEEVVGEMWRLHAVRSGGRALYLGARTFANHPFKVGQSTVSAFSPAPDALVEVGSRLLDHVGFEGAGVIQFVDRGGEWHVHDVNLRLPSSVAGTVAAGIDMPRLAVEIALGAKPALDPVRVRPLRVVQLSGEMDALRDALTGGPAGRSWRSILGGIVGAAVLPRRRLTPFDLTDPMPTIAALARIRPSAGRTVAA